MFIYNPRTCPPSSEPEAHQSRGAAKVRALELTSRIAGSPDTSGCYGGCIFIMVVFYLTDFIQPSSGIELTNGGVLQLGGLTQTLAGIQKISGTGIRKIRNAWVRPGR